MKLSRNDLAAFVAVAAFVLWLYLYAIPKIR